MNERTVEDGFGSVWLLCKRADCDLQVVRPGKVQCRCEWEPDGCPQVGAVSWPIKEDEIGE